MSEGDIETYFEDGVWKNKVDGTLVATSVHERRTNAILVGRTMARTRRVLHTVKDEDGNVTERRDFGEGSDTRPEPVDHG